MSNPSKKKGTAAETKVVKFLREHGIEASRVALNGSKDIGDIHFEADGSIHLLEVKAGEQTKAPSRSQIEEWIRQANTERDNLYKRNEEMGSYQYIFAYLVVVRHGRKIQDADVYCHHNYGIKMIRPRDHWYLDEFAEYFTDKSWSKAYAEYCEENGYK